MTAKTFALALAAGCALLPGTAGATLISGAGSLPGAQLLAIPAISYAGAGPIDFGVATWTSNQTDSTISGGVIKLQRDNVDGQYQTMTITFDRPVTGVLALINWNTNYSTTGNSTIFVARDSSGAALLQPGCNIFDQFSCYWQLNDNGSRVGRNGHVYPVGPGYYGYTFANPVIKSIDFDNGSMSASAIYFAGMAGGVPEPANWALLIGGFALTGALARRRGRIVAA